MNPTDSPTELLEEEILSKNDTDTLGLSDEYAASVSRQGRLPETELIELIRKQFGESADVLAAANTDSELLVHLSVLSKRLTNISFESAVRAALVLQGLDRGPPETEGVPEGYLPILGDQLESVLQLYQRVIVYVWRYECPPCEVMKSELEEVPPALTETIGQFAIYGPNSAAYLQNNYDVPGGPTLLFGSDGRIQSRLFESQYRDIIESEIRSLRENQSG